MNWLYDNIPSLWWPKLLCSWANKILWVIGIEPCCVRGHYLCKGLLVDRILVYKNVHHLNVRIHPKLRNINLHDFTHSLISWHPRERMFVVQISLLIVTFLSLISQILSWMQTTKEDNPHPRIAPCVNMWSVTLGPVRTNAKLWEEQR